MPDDDTTGDIKPFRLSEEDRYFIRITDEAVARLAMELGISKNVLAGAITARARDGGLDLDHMSLAEAGTKLGNWVRANHAGAKEAKRG